MVQSYCTSQLDQLGNLKISFVMIILKKKKDNATLSNMNLKSFNIIFLYYKCNENLI